MGQLAGILNIFGFVAVLAMTICVLLLIYYGIIQLNQLKSLLVFISRKGIWLTPEALQQFFFGAFTFKECLLFNELQDEHKRDRSGKKLSTQYILLDEEIPDARNIGLCRTRFVTEENQ